MARRPFNVLLITTDEERARLPCPSGFSLPAHERLATGGVSFRNYYAASTMCSSSRSVIYTGRHVPVTEIYDNDNMPYIRPLDPELGTLGTMLRSRGYYTAYQGKWHLSNAYVDPSSPRSTVDDLEPYGFSDWNDWGDIDGGAWAGLRVDPVIAGQAAGWLRNRAAAISAEQPWFLAVNFVNPHDIMSFDFGGRPGVELPMGLSHAVAVRPPAAVPLYQRVWDLELPATLHDDLEDAPPAVREYRAMLELTFGAVADDARWLAGLNFYLNCIRDVDRSIELVLDALVASGEADRTVVIFTADHGDMVGSHGLRQKANLVYDENFHVPLIVCHPDGPRGVTVDALASAVDLAPTLLAVAGATDDEIATEFPGLPGHNLLPTLAGEQVRDGVLTAVESITTLDASFWTNFADPDIGPRIASGEVRPDWTHRGFLRGYTDERFSFGRYFSPLEPNRPVDLSSLYANNDVVLYDRLSDPDETTNLAADPSAHDLVATLNTKLEALIDAEVGEDMRAWVTERPNLLGWPTWNGDAPTGSRAR